MNWLPLYFKPQGQSVLVFGSGDVATRKVRFLQRTEFPITVISIDETAKDRFTEFESVDVIHSTGLDSLSSQLFENVIFAVAASEDHSADVFFAQQARQAGIPVHVAHSIDDSDFLLPAVIDRGPISVAVSSAGQHPTLTRLVRNRIESVLPARLEALAELALRYKDKVREKLSTINARRAFWERQLEGRVADLVYSGRDEDAERLLLESLDSITSSTQGVGEVYLVGAGPGDPDLLSFKALRLIRQADVVLFDRLVSPQILNLVRQDADMIDVGKRRSHHTMQQESINELLAKLAKQGKRVLRLKGGDPFIFGRGGEEIETLSEHGVPFQVVPGITAAAGCASYSGIPLTHRDHAQSVRFVTGHLKNNSSELDWPSLVAEQQTLVFYMGLVALPQIAEGLLNQGMSQDMPVAVISRGTLPDQRVLISSLSRVAADVTAAELKAPTIIIIGTVVNLHEKLGWQS
ncbi:MAG: siroheme synthase CysG [Oleiphilaceae bacterium]|nr:siroheme synthase CysG [Oleiphilaceae bacterium]